MPRIFITGDTHGSMDYHKLSNKKWKEQKSLTGEDVLIIAGDWGVLWNDKYIGEEKYLLDWYSNKPYRILIVDGNHENHEKFSQLKTVDLFGAKVGQIASNIFHLKRGHVYNIDKNTFFIMGGAKSIDRIYRTEGESWWPEEVPSVAEKQFGLTQLQQYDWKIDYVITHTAPSSIIRSLPYIDYWKMKDKTSNYLDKINNSLKFKRWFFGHFHVDITLLNGRYEALYNRILEIT